ncbi:hypothetical protein ACFL2T_04230 [Elusimicrobiota bacterium]
MRRSAPAPRNESVTRKAYSISTEVVVLMIGGVLTAVFPNHAFGSVVQTIDISTKGARATVSFEQFSECSGFDADAFPPAVEALMVPLSGSNSVKAIITPQFAVPHISLRSSDPAIADPEPKTPQSAEQTITISAGNVVDNATIEALPRGGTLALADVFVEVKEQKTFTIAIHAITEENDDEGLPPGTPADPSDVCVSPGDNDFRDTIPHPDDELYGDNIIAGANGQCDTTKNTSSIPPSRAPTASQVRTGLDGLWGPQANIFFTVERNAVEVNYDVLDRDGKLRAPILGDVQSQLEVAKISLAAKTETADINIYYVKGFTTEKDNGIAIFIEGEQKGEIWIDDSHINSTVNITAHEVGHILGNLTDAEHSGDSADLMFGSERAEDPCRIRRFDWHRAHP